MKSNKLPSLRDLTSKGHFKKLEWKTTNLHIPQMIIHEQIVIDHTDIITFIQWHMKWTWSKDLGQFVSVLFIHEKQNT